MRLDAGWYVNRTGAGQAHRFNATVAPVAWSRCGRLSREPQFLAPAPDQAPRCGRCAALAARADAFRARAA